MPARLVLRRTHPRAVPIVGVVGVSGGMVTVVPVSVAVPVAGFGDRGVGVDEPGQRPDGLADVPVVLDDDRRGVGQHRGVELLHAEHGQRAGPVDGLGDRGRLAQLQLAQPADDLDQLLGQRLGQPGVLAAHDLQLALGRRGSPGTGAGSGVSARPRGRGCCCEVSTTYGGCSAVNVPTSGTEIWNSASVSSSTASSASSARSTSSISSTTGSSERIASSSGRGGEEALGEEHAVLRADPVDGRLEVGGVGDDLADLLAQDLGVEQLLAVVPLVERLGLVLALVALQPQQPAAGDPRRAPWPARSCRRRPGPRRAAACPAGSPGRRWWRAGCRRCSRARAARP